ncbi:MAG: efflux RND transporter permease subunit [Planctomycetia bacterium]|nr:efflux RND transporter permease subunit [Planctomycetia bacterium]
MSDPAPRGITTRIVEIFLTSRLSMLFLIASLVAGAAALWVTPREEEPQIVVPFADVFVSVPGVSPEQVEKLVATPLESRLWEIDGVEDVYSASRPGQAVATVRFKVGQDRERSLVKIWNKMMSSQDTAPPQVAGWVVKPVEIDDLPIVLVTLWSPSPRYGEPELRRIADEVLDRIQRVPDAGRAWVAGGPRRRVRVELDPGALSSRGITALDVSGALRGANVNIEAGTFQQGGREFVVEAGPLFESAADAASAVVGAVGGRAVYLRDVARVTDGSEEPESYTRIGFGPGASRLPAAGGPQAAAAAPPAGEERPQVTIAACKRKGTNAVRVAEEVLAAVEALRGTAIPADVVASVTRNSGRTADHKVNELVKHLVIAIVTIIVLLAISLGPREAFIVALAVPMTLAITLLLDDLTGYTINRVTLFALILSIGLLVDDPIVDVENIFRHFRLGKQPPLEATRTAIEEVRPPTIFATLTVIVSFLPMFFITGMMGPYMGPMAFNVPVAMIMSLIVAFTVTPWAAYTLLKPGAGPGGHDDDAGGSRLQRLYAAALRPIVRSRGRTLLFLGAVALAFLSSLGLAAAGAVPFKMLPFDNKDELQVVLDMPEGTPLEVTDAAARDLGRALAQVPEVAAWTTFSGVGSPMDFNGMVRHDYLRRGGNVADLRVNLLAAADRTAQSHEIALRIRPRLQEVAARHRGARVKIVEAPPGPPVLATLVAEVSGPAEAPPEDLDRVAGTVRELFARTPGVVDVDDFVETPRAAVYFRIDREKAALHGIPAADIAGTLRTALGGDLAAPLGSPTERAPVPIEVRLPVAARSSVPDLLALRVRSATGVLVPLSELGTASEGTRSGAIYHKNLKRVSFVTAECAGVSPVDAVLALRRSLRESPLPAGYTADFAGEGEWKITLDVFRDLGLAFAAALAMIFVLLVAQTGSLSMPLVIMVAIPLTLIGIVPGFWFLNAAFARPVGSIPNPVFFTATGMIGMIALAGIVVRNSIILIDFTEKLRARPGTSLTDAVVEAGAVRLRPIFLTAGAAMFGSVVITLDPVFSGLAWSFIFGIFASTGFTLLVVPAIFHLLHRGRDETPPA